MRRRVGSGAARPCGRRGCLRARTTGAAVHTVPATSGSTMVARRVKLVPPTRPPGARHRRRRASARAPAGRRRATSGEARRHALFVDDGERDRFLAEAPQQVAMLPAEAHGRFVVQLDLRHEQARIPAGALLLGSRPSGPRAPPPLPPSAWTVRSAVTRPRRAPRDVRARRPRPATRPARRRRRRVVRVECATTRSPT